MCRVSRRSHCAYGLAFPLDVPKFENMNESISISVLCVGDEGGFTPISVKFSVDVNGWSWCGVEQRRPPAFDRAAITLGIAPHSSLYKWHWTRS